MTIASQSIGLFGSSLAEFCQSVDPTPAASLEPHSHHDFSNRVASCYDVLPHNIEVCASLKNSEAKDYIVI